MDDVRAQQDRIGLVEFCRDAVVVFDDEPGEEELVEFSAVFGSGACVGLVGVGGVVECACEVAARGVGVAVKGFEALLHLGGVVKLNG